jgi:hypothetical protein
MKRTRNEKHDFHFTANLHGGGGGGGGGTLHLSNKKDARQRRSTEREQK